MSSSPDGYDAAADSFGSYYAAIEAKRLRGDTHYPGKRETDRMREWRVVSPAPRTGVLALAGAHARVRRLCLAQVRDGDSAAVYRGDRCLAVVFFRRHGWRRIEMALALEPQAWPHMRRLVRLAQLTLRAMSDTHLIVTNVRPGHRPGERMAAMVGFRPARIAGLWTFRKGGDGKTSRRRQRGCQTGG